jgi:hypothetical protein
MKDSIQLSDYRKALQLLDSKKDNSPAESSLKLWQQDTKKLSCFYAPFDHVNRQADIIIAGITPGRTQMNRSINALKLAMDSEQDINTALKSVKQHASLSGSMRPRIVEMLNRLGYAKLLDIECCSSLWAEHNHRVHFCSVLKYPIFVGGKDYCGQPKLFNTPELQQLLFEEFVHDISTINPKAVIVPLGEMVAAVLTTLHQQGHIQQQLTTFQNKVVAPPHPSGANAESIALLLRQDYPTLHHYQDEMYQQYRRKQSWLKRENGQAQAEARYKKARAARWQAMSHVRQAYGI